MDEVEWEHVASPTMGDYTERLPVPGGWLYRVFFKNRDHVVALVFVPEPPKEE